MTDTSTLVGIASARRARRARAGRRVFLALIFLMVLAGLATQLGVRSRTAQVVEHGYRLRVTYAAVTRPGLDTPFIVEVGAAKTLPKELTIGVDLAYVDLFDENGGLNPEVSSSSADERFVYWTFDTNDTNTFKVSLDAILATAQQWGRGATVKLIVDKKTVAATNIHTWVLP